eukprot:TRINITY_DN17044_c0_g1_i2.p1 TRINITY_DN17044_c0_g1~~TRINITY_DN17044_c0_g1_i2.p1  ORF type:complete len:184 (-),score=41.26 TRINITY_DN17044_c0_g1_i2:53-604(-)
MDLQKDVVMAEEPAEAAEELLEDDDVEADLGVDTEDLLDGASGGVPTNEKMRIAQECVVGRPRGLGTVAARTAYLGKLARADKKMLRDRLSHLAEGSYDINGDVVRVGEFLDASYVAQQMSTLGGYGRAPAGVPYPQASALEDPDLMLDVAGHDREEDAPLFHRRGDAKAAQANRRRRSDGDE